MGMGPMRDPRIVRPSDGSRALDAILNASRCCVNTIISKSYYPRLLARSGARRNRALLAVAGFAAIWVGAGRLAQLVERLLYTQDVGGSSPSPPTSLRGCAATAGRPASLNEAQPR